MILKDKEKVSTNLNVNKLDEEYLWREIGKKKKLNTHPNPRQKKKKKEKERCTLKVKSTSFYDP